MVYRKMQFGLTLALLVAICNGATNKVEFTISGSDLPNMDVWNGPPDPYVKVAYAEGSSIVYKPMGETEKLSNTKNPIFETLFAKNFVVGANQRFRLSVWDQDVESGHDGMGQVDVTLAEIANSGASPVVKQIQGCPPEKGACGRLLIGRRI